MKDRLEAAEQAAEGALATALELALYRAFARKHGVKGLPQVPAKKTREVTDADKAAIVAARARRSSDANWLLLGRDPVCVELDLTGDQVAGVLAEVTRKANEAAVPQDRPETARRVATPVVVAAQPRTSGRSGAIAVARALLNKPADATVPANWPPRLHFLNGGKATEPPAKGHAERKADDADKRVIIAARVQVSKDADWDTFRQAYGAHRRLTTQQIAKVVADHTLTKQVTQAAAQA